MEIIGMSSRPNWPEPDIQEQSGLVELPITGFVIRMRGDTVRLIGYIRRGIGQPALAEPTMILHLPRTGFALSLRQAIARWNEDHVAGRDRHWQ